MTQEIKFVVGENAAHVLDWKRLKLLNNRDYMNCDIVAARFMVDENGDPIPYEQALEILGAVPGDEVAPLFGKFLEVFNAATLNPTNGDS